MKILWLSWRDIKNPDSGGAEKIAIQVASRFVKDGHKVTIFTSNFKGAKQHEIIRGVNIIRRGNRLTCRVYAFFYYQKNKSVDLIIDEINTIPFFTNLYAKSKSIALIHQLAKEYWYTETFWPISTLGYLLESPMLKLYKNSPTLALSASTKKDLEKIGFSKVKTYRPGIDFKPQLVTKKEDLILFLGRLIPAKGPLDAIRAFKIIHNSFPDIKLSIIGRGNPKYLTTLKKEVKKTKLDRKVKFEGYVSENRKIDLLKQAQIILIPSVREGWGLVATEANALRCIPVAYNVPGLKNAIKNNKNGILVS